MDQHYVSRELVGKPRLAETLQAHSWKSNMMSQLIDLSIMQLQEVFLLLVTKSLPVYIILTHSLLHILEWSRARLCTAPLLAAMTCSCCVLCAQLVLDMHLVIQAMPQHLLGVLMATNCGVLDVGPHWAEGLTDCKLTDSGPLDHLVRGAGVLVTILELLPRYRSGGPYSSDQTVAVRDRCLCSGSSCSTASSTLIAGSAVSVSHSAVGKNARQKEQQQQQWVNRVSL
jgi:hypothetical protein